jgi:hypothetical protein
VALAVVALLVGLLVGLATPTASAQPATAQPATASAHSEQAAARAAQPLDEHSVSVRVLSVSPSTPAASDTPKALTIRLSLENTTDQSLDEVTVHGDRGNPISTQAALESAIAKPAPPDPGQVAPFKADTPVTTSLGPRASTVVVYKTTSDLGQDAALCICQNRIYPLYFTVHTLDQNGADLLVGSGQSYVPSFVDKPQPVQVSWVWPIIDAPHRLTADVTPAPADGPLFLDDKLASSVAGGRLDRVLRVVELVGKRVPMTLVIDPELIDELAVMSVGPYRVGTTTKFVAGVGTSAAQLWLARLRTVLDNDPGLEVDFTPFADPDVETLTRNGLSWTTSLGRAAQDRITAALGGHTPSTNIAWPVDEKLSADTLAAVARRGVQSVILNDTALPRGANASPALNALAALQTPAGPVQAIVTSRNIERYVGPVLSVGGTGLAKLPELVSELAIRAVEDGTAQHYAAIVPPRYIDPDPAVAQRAILDTAATTWSTGLTLNTATTTVPPVDHGQLVPPPASGATLSPLTIQAAQDLTRMVPALASMLGSNKNADAVLGPLPAAVQRAESSYWRAYPLDGDNFAKQLSERIKDIESGVAIASTGTYTLASSNSPLLITIKNTLPYDVTVRLSITTVNGLPGFTAGDVGELVIGAKLNRTVKVPTHVARSGRFLVNAVLLTPSGIPVGQPVTLTVHSTALGTIGVIITVVAAAVLLLALLIRVARRWRGRGRTEEVPVVADPVAVP